MSGISFQLNREATKTKNYRMRTQER